jgi:DNA-binding MarR family transcriptional regulator
MTNRTPKGDAFTAVVLRIMRTNGLLSLAGDTITKSVGQSSARWQVMGAIDDEAMTVAEIARIFGMARQSIQRVADALVHEGIATYADNPAHQRAKLVALTVSGKKSLKVIQEGQRIWANRIGEQLGERSLKQMVVLLQQLSDVVENDPLINCKQ